MLLNCGAGEDSWVSWTARRSNQSILKEINSENSLEGLMLKLQYLATWCEEPTHWKRPWCWERSRARGEEGDRGWDRWHHWLNGHESEQTLRDGEGYRSLVYYGLWSHRIGHAFELGFCINPFYRPEKLLKVPQSITGRTRGPIQEVWPLVSGFLYMLRPALDHMGVSLLSQKIGREVRAQDWPVLDQRNLI